VSLTAVIVACSSHKHVSGFCKRTRKPMGSTLRRSLSCGAELCGAGVHVGRRVLWRRPKKSSNGGRPVAVRAWNVSVV